MEMFGHYHVADYDKAILLPGALQDTQKQVTALAAVKLRTTPITTAGYEVQIVPTISALQPSRHAPKISGADHSGLRWDVPKAVTRGTHSFEPRE